MQKLSKHYFPSNFPQVSFVEEEKRKEKKNGGGRGYNGGRGQNHQFFCRALQLCMEDPAEVFHLEIKRPVLSSSSLEPEPRSEKQPDGGLFQ